MENEQHIKSLQTDARGKNRLKYISTKERAKLASADVYRAYHRRGIGVTTAASREERLHNPQLEESQRSQKRQRIIKADDGGRVAVLRKETDDVPDEVMSDDDSAAACQSSNFASELDIANDRNASEIFGHFYQHVWPLVRSLPELLHHAPQVVEALVSYMLSPASSPGEKSLMDDEEREKKERYVVNHATTDILHMMGALARDLRHEIHPFLHKDIMPRIIHDLLNPPIEPSVQQQPLSVTVVEAAFRTLSYIFRYDVEQIIGQVDKPGQEPCLEQMRQYYGVTLAHRREVVRRLAAESFAPLIRKIKTDTARCRHLRRILRALAAVSTVDTPGSTDVRMKRTQADAIDGISQLFFQVARGISGRMHSKGRLVVESLLNACAKDFPEKEIIVEVASSFFQRLSAHLDADEFALIVNDLLAMTKKQLPSKTASQKYAALSNCLRLIVDVVSFRDGEQLREIVSADGADESVATGIIHILEVLSNELTFPFLTPPTRKSTLMLLCTTWKALKGSTTLQSSLESLLPGLLKHDALNGIDETPGSQQLSDDSPIRILLHELLPHLPQDVAMGSLGSATLIAAATLSKANPWDALSLVHVVATTHVATDEEEDDVDTLLFVENASSCSVPSSVKETLLSTALMNVELKDLTIEKVTRIGVAARCAAFVIAVSTDSGDEKLQAQYKRVTKWLFKMLHALDGESVSTLSHDEGKALIVVQAFLIESLALMTKEMSPRIRNRDSVEKTLRQAKEFSEAMLLSNAASLWTVKSAAALVEVCQAVNVTFSENRDAVFEKIVPNLRKESHFLRLHTLQILASFGTRSYVTDHAELDLSGDLDEEKSSFPNQANDRASAVVSGACDVIDTLLSLEASPVNLVNERHILSLISRIEVLARCGRLPVAFTEAAANHLLGVFHVKFAAIWPVATSALVALAENNTDLLWPSLHAMMIDVMEPPPTTPERSNAVEHGLLLNPTNFFEKCCRWESSVGCDFSLFQHDVSASQDEGRVSRHQHTDPSTRFELVWHVLEEADCILLKKSRDIVPIFLDFLKNQYFVFFEDDPNAREISLEIEQSARWKRDALSKGMMQARLLSILKAFGVIKGPRQLYKTETLKTIFTAFLTHSDFNVAQLSLNCLVKYKLAHVTPYIEHLRAMFKRFELRETLLKFETSGGSDQENRKSLMPLLSRILFGRLSARALGNKSSRDSPAARRTAVLAFLSRQCEDDEDMYPFIYLMVRSFIPKTYKLKPVEDHDNDDRLQVDRLLQSIKGADLMQLTPQVLEGFLYLLEAVVAQLGQRLKAFVPQLMSIVMAISNLVQQHFNSETEASVPLLGQEEGPLQYEANSRGGAIRTLCFRRLSDIYSQFSSTADLSPFTISLWAYSRGSVNMLPQVVVNSDKVPALMYLLRTLSSHPNLIPILTANDEAVKAVFLCISNTSSDAVMDAALSIVENLLADCKDSADPNPSDGKYAELGWKTIRDHLPLLLRQFTNRLRGSPESPINPVSSGRRKALVSTMWRRELGILCRISDVALQGRVTPGEGDKDSLEALCDLLIPFLGKRGAVTEGDQMNVLGILQSCWSKIGMESALSHFEALSRLLGPSNGHPGVSSFQVRLAIATAVEAVADRIGSTVARKASKALVKLSSINSKRVDEMDYESVIPTINGLFDASHETSWHRFLLENEPVNGTTGTTEPTTLLMLSPLVYCCCHQMFDTDGVVSRGSFKAVKTLVGILCPVEGSGQGIVNPADWANNNSTRKFLESTMIPLIRQGLNARNVTVRKYFILILSDVARGCRLSDSPNLYGDLHSLTNDDDQDLDFFLNITHVQIHRRARAFQRLRKFLNEDSDERKAIFTLQSLSNILLPLAMHPVYECRTKAEESFALEAIETAGAIARHLSWSKYHSAIWTPLAMFDRHPEQERYLIGAICAIIDGFHFDVNSLNEGEESPEGAKNSVLRALEKRVIPRIEGLMTKEKSNRDGTKTKTLRATVVLALFKLFKKFPKHYFEARLARLLAVICGALRDKDSDARDVARNTLAKMAADIDVLYLGDIIRELAVSLTEGYQLHVRSATLHTMLLGLSKSYQPAAPTLGGSSQVPTLDYCVPAIMDLIQQDLFGEARDRREVEGAKVRYVKEASGSKGLDSIEIICSLICFHPSTARASQGKILNPSSIHAVVTPLLERLRAPEVDSATIRRIAQCLLRVVSGISRNPSVTREELLPFIYATIEPFIGDQAANATSRLESEGDENEGTSKPLSVTRNGNLLTKVESSNMSGPNASAAVVEWRPSALQSSKDSGDALKRKNKEARDLRLVQDGANAPKLTGSARHSNRNGVQQVQTLNLPANIQAVLFGLNLLQSALKRFKRLEDDHAVSMLDPFVPLLTACACYCRDTDLVLVSLRCLILMFPMRLPSIGACARSLGTKTLDILGSSGGMSQVQSETAQASFKLMTFLMKLDKSAECSDITDVTDGSKDANLTIADENALAGGIVPLDSEQMVVLLAIVQGAVAEAGQHNQALGLISALVSRRFISPEFYDLIEKVLELSVRSHTASVRLQASNVFTQYLLNYPMEKQRVEQHLKQVVLNTKYEYEAGRLSAIGLATALVEKLPATVLGEYAQLFFLPLVLQLVNDDSKDCREAIANCLSRLLKRIPLDVVRSIYEYVVKWSEGTESLQRTALQLFGLFVDAREDFISRQEVARPLLVRLTAVLADKESVAPWEIVYFSLTCLEKLATSCSTLLSQQTDLLVSVVFHLKHSHPWIKQVSTRIVSSLLSVKKGSTDNFLFLPEFLVARPGTLFDMAQNLCTQMEADDIEQNEDSSGLTVKTLVRVLQAMENCQDLSLPSVLSGVETKDPIKWIITRLSHSAKPKRPNVRTVVFKFFAALTTYCTSMITPLLELMLEPLHRSISEASNELDNPDIVNNKSANLEDTPVSIESSLARDVLQLLEEQVDADTFLTAYAIVKTRAKEKKEQRKILAKSEAARNPEVAAKRKVIKHDREKRRRKRKNEEHRRQRGGLKRTRTA